MYNDIKKYALIGKRLSHSFSKQFFEEKFRLFNFKNIEYQNYELENLQNFREWLKDKNLNGFNITIPYKQEIIPYCDFVEENSSEINAVNTVFIDYYNALHGYNTDVIGFEKSTLNYLRTIKKALIIGNGASSNTIAFVLRKHQISYKYLVRNIKGIGDELLFNIISETDIKEVDLIINTTPIGMYPNVNDFPDIPYNAISSKHFVFDLIYNPTKSLFLQKAERQGAKVKNGLEMLQIQAEESWKIWNTNKIKI